MKKIIICAICAICGLTTANAQGKFGHVNTQEIMQAMPEYTQAESEIKALQSQYEADLKSMQDELQKKGEAFDKEQATLPDNIKQRRQQELQEMYQKIQQSYQDNQQALQKASNEKMQAITAKILEADRWLCLHHGEQLTALHQHHTLYRCDCSGKGKTGIEVI